MNGMKLGPWLEGNEAHVRVWAPEHTSLELVQLGPDGSTEQSRVRMEPAIR